jgi:glycerophosphoryl diester phosphodiesterase
MKRLTYTLIITIAALCMMPVSVVAQKHKDKVGIVAHRGYWNCEEAGYAHNSIAALRCAQEAGCWGSEFDVCMTSDEVLLVFHDDIINGKKIEKHPHSAFKDFRLKNGEHIPTLEEYLIQAKKYPKTVLVYELKPHSSRHLEDRYVDLTIKKLKEHKLLNPKKVIFISFSLHMCEKLARELPGFTVQYLNGDLTPAQLKAKGINGLDYHFNTMAGHPAWSKEAKKMKMSRNAWTVNDKKTMNVMFGIGIDQITTDNPLEARKVLKDMKMKEKKPNVKRVK